MSRQYKNKALSIIITQLSVHIYYLVTGLATWDTARHSNFSHISNFSISYILCVCHYIILLYLKVTIINTDYF